MPSPKPKVTLDFFEALRAVLTGAQITKSEWEDKACYGVLRGGQLMLHKSDGKFYQWIISEGDMLGEDWMVLMEPAPVH